MTSTDRTDGPGRTVTDDVSFAGGRPTRQRRAVATVLESCDDFRSAQDIHDLLRRNGENVGLSTVYRTLQALADADAVDMLRTEDGEAVYRRCSTTHHHHLVCRTCGRTVEVEGPTVERWSSTVAREHGFTDVSHTLEIFGTCPSCA
jgi:Fur family ferric uptake transcriptional regulator